MNFVIRMEKGDNAHPLEGTVIVVATNHLRNWK